MKKPEINMAQEQIIIKMTVNDSKMTAKESSTCDNMIE